MMKESENLRKANQVQIQYYEHKVFVFEPEKLFYIV